MAWSFLGSRARRHNRIVLDETCPSFVPNSIASWAEYATAAIAGDADAMVRLYTDSAYVVESGLPTIRGNAALRSVVKDVLSGVRFLESSIRPELTEVVGDRVLQFGEYRDVLQPIGKPVQVVVGRFAAVLQRDSTASWRVSRLIAVADSTVPQTATSK